MGSVTKDSHGLPRTARYRLLNRCRRVSIHPRLPATDTDRNLQSRKMKKHIRLWPRRRLASISSELWKACRTPSPPNLSVEYGASSFLARARRSAVAVTRPSPSKPDFLLLSRSSRRNVLLSDSIFARFACAITQSGAPPAGQKRNKPSLAKCLLACLSKQPIQRMNAGAAGIRLPSPRRK